MRQSSFFIPTLKEVPNEAQIPSHQLMLRAGLIRQLASGIFTWLPFGYIALKKVMNILREEIDKIGGQEFLYPALNPIEIWEETGRVEAMGDVMFHIKNREGLVLAPTHEEIVTYHAKQHLQSYRDLPQIWYQIQNKFRNEARPKSGVLRGRQFIMKDSYSMDSNWEGLDVSYQNHFDAYCKIFDRCNIKFFVVGASSGSMGGKKSQEFMVEADAGEDVCAISDSGYSANIEVAVSAKEKIVRLALNDEIVEFETPNSKTIDELIKCFNLNESSLAKSVIYIVNDKPILILMSGNDELNETKLSSIFETNSFRPAEAFELFNITGANAGSIGPINLKQKIEIYADLRLEDANNLISGANKDGYHFKNIDLRRDTQIIAYYDFRTVKANEPDIINGSPIRVVKAIELGHIFKLGTKYSEALKANILDENGKENPIIMGSYGIGVERVLACYIEQNHDENGIIWQTPLAPFHVHLLGLMIEKSDEVKNACERLYLDLSKAGFEVLFDDRIERPGVKFNDADLIGLPLQIIVGNKNLVDGNIEVKIRKTGERQIHKLDEIIIVTNEYFKL
ncbi:MAG: proline--tRNA ligase [Candidatus Kapabacteria bacterium]|nr:proline--tRNA ligase [Candidatus Kapabacteria bacterium]